MPGDHFLPRLIHSLLACGTLVLLLSSCQSSREIYGNKPGPKGFRTVVLDAGHGGRDSGAKARGLQEKHLTLDLSLRVAKELGNGFKVVLLRDEDDFTPLDDRVRMANRHRDAVLISLHFNYGPRRLSGPETYYWRVDSYALAKRIQEQLDAACPGKHANRGLVRRRLRLTRNPTIPCVLVECGYLTHPKEASLLRSGAYRDKLTQALARAVREQQQLGDAGQKPLPPPIFAPPSKAGDARDAF